MKQNGYDVSQYIIDNMVVCENRKYRDLNPYNNLMEDLIKDSHFTFPNFECANPKPATLPGTPAAHDVFQLLFSMTLNFFRKFKF